MHSGRFVRLAPSIVCCPEGGASNCDSTVSTTYIFRVKLVDALSQIFLVYSHPPLLFQVAIAIAIAIAIARP